jgi:hypothetical protein
MLQTISQNSTGKEFCRKRRANIIMSSNNDLKIILIILVNSISQSFRWQSDATLRSLLQLSWSHDKATISAAFRFSCCDSHIWHQTDTNPRNASEHSGKKPDPERPRSAPNRVCDVLLEFERLFIVPRTPRQWFALDQSLPTVQLRFRSLRSRMPL